MLSARDTVLALPNVWLLVSTENQETYDERVAELLQCPAVVRGVSAEPLLGPIDLGLGRWVRLTRPITRFGQTAPAGIHRAMPHHQGGLHIDGAAIGRPTDVPIERGEYEHLPDLDWVIIGGESGAGCRPCELRWIRDMLAQSRRHNEIAVRAGQPRTHPFLKQLGGAAVDAENGLVGRLYVVDPDAGRMVRTRLQDGHGGDEREFPADLQGHRHFPVPRLHRQPDRPLVPPQPARSMAQLGLL